mmetsp:Transcript_14794/g.21738  ORF Transcript_14794/g.21738 Transcript_14794/m.21738 type:complete len:124 (+) Transcript_14794:289-660(+)
MSVRLANNGSVASVSGTMMLYAGDDWRARSFDSFDLDPLVPRMLPVDPAATTGEQPSEKQEAATKNLILVLWKEWLDISSGVETSSHGYIRICLIHASFPIDDLLLGTWTSNRRAENAWVLWW